VLGTVEGDIHDIGKDIVGTMLDIAGFDVVDLAWTSPLTSSSRPLASARPRSSP